MPVAVVENIRTTLVTRLDALTGSEVVEPTRFGGYRPKDMQIVVNQGPTTTVQIIAGNPPALERETTFNVRGRLMGSEKVETAKDKLANAFHADVHGAICVDESWHTFGGYAIDASVGDVELMQEDTGGSVLMVPVVVTYRHSEYDMTEQR